MVRVRFDQLDTVSNCLGVVGYIPPEEVIKGSFHDRVDGYTHLWCVDHGADIDRSILKVPTEEIIHENHNLWLKPQKAKGKRERMV